MKKVNVCLTQVDIRDNATAILIGKLAVRQAQNQPKPSILAMLPLGSLLPAGALVKVDDKEPIKLAYNTCDQAGCYAEAEVEPALVEQMKTGKQVAYLGIDVTGRQLAIPLPLEGFAKAVNGAPVPEDKYREDQRKIADVIRRGFRTCASSRKTLRRTRKVLRLRQLRLARSKRLHTKEAVLRRPQTSYRSRHKRELFYLRCSL